MQLTFLRPYDECLVQIAAFEQDKTNPRFGQPTEYTITQTDTSTQTEGSTSVSFTSGTIHWSRVIHLADNLGASEVFGVPRMQPVYNRLYDLRKLYSGSAEMYWKGAFPGYAVQTNPQKSGEVEIDLSSMRTEMEKMFNGLQRWVGLEDLEVNSLAPQVSDPTPQIDTQIEAICIRLGIPKRVFTGSERGQLASSQDRSTWLSRLSARQNNYLSPRVIVPFVDRLIQVGVLPQPKSYSIVWPDLESLTEEEQATVAVKRTEALAKYVQSGSEVTLHPMDFLVRILGMSQDEATKVLEKVLDTADEESFTIPDETPEEEVPEPEEEIPTERE
jgi:hypothetical protein